MKVNNKIYQEYRGNIFEMHEGVPINRITIEELLFLLLIEIKEIKKGLRKE